MEEREKKPELLRIGEVVKFGTIDLSTEDPVHDSSPLQHRIKRI
jgi:hypothetical protein